ncbi:hypothetical protein [Halobacteriovorax sp. YZS-1-1]|uniref:hypothetical protein n=1 Tax=unclassified Halobacteriovorax TaxID=2639665 RepID=UPI00399B6209
MKKVILVISMALAISSNVYSQTCSKQYKQDVAKFNDSRLVKMSTHAHNGVHYVSTYALNAIFGLHVFPAFLAYPIFLRVIKAHQDKLHFYIDLLEGDNDSEQMNELLNALYEPGMTIDISAVRNELNYLNESGALCDGSVFSRVTGHGPRHRRRKVAIKVPSKERLVKHLKNVLK